MTIKFLQLFPPNRRRKARNSPFSRLWYIFSVKQVSDPLLTNPLGSICKYNLLNSHSSPISIRLDEANRRENILFGKIQATLVQYLGF